MNELPTEILTRVDALAERLGVTVEYLWPRYVEYEWSCGLSLFIAALVLGIALGLVGRGLHRRREAIVRQVLARVSPAAKERLSFYTTCPEDEALMGYRVWMIVCVVLGALPVVLFCIALPSVLAPEGAALKGLLP